MALPVLHPYLSSCVSPLETLQSLKHKHHSGKCLLYRYHNINQITLTISFWFKLLLSSLHSSAEFLITMFTHLIRRNKFFSTHSLVLPPSVLPSLSLTGFSKYMYNFHIKNCMPKPGLIILPFHIFMMNAIILLLSFWYSGFLSDVYVFSA